MKLILASLLVLIPSICLSDTKIMLHGFSYHTDRNLIKDVNEVNLGVGLRVDHIEAGIYKDSFGNPNAYIRYDSNPNGFGWFFGASSGYKGKPNDLGPFAVIGGLSYHNDNLSISVAPTGFKKRAPSAVIGFSFVGAVW